MIVRRMRAAWSMLLETLVLLVLSGCTYMGQPQNDIELAVEAAMRPLLNLDADCNWAENFNELVDLAPHSLAYLARQPALQRPAAADDLGVMIHTSLLRMLGNPATVPKLSANCLETTLDVLHFDLKVAGRALGPIVLTTRRPPRAWTQLYPLEFDHGLAGRIDVEADRRRMLEWWQRHALDASAATSRKFKPRSDDLWSLLSRAYADRWRFLPEARATLCDGLPAEPALFEDANHAYTLVRGACIQLGSLQNPDVQDRLILLLGSPVPTVAANARFALGFSPDPRVRKLIERYNLMRDENPVPAPERAEPERPMKM